MEQESAYIRADQVWRRHICEFVKRSSKSRGQSIIERKQVRAVFWRSLLPPWFLFFKTAWVLSWTACKYCIKREQKALRTDQNIQWETAKARKPTKPGASRSQSFPITRNSKDLARLKPTSNPPHVVSDFLAWAGLSSNNHIEQRDRKRRRKIWRTVGKWCRLDLD